MKDLRLLQEGFGHFLHATRELNEKTDCKCDNEECKCGDSEPNNLNESGYYFTKQDDAELKKLLPRLIKALQHLQNVNRLEDVDFYSLSALLNKAYETVRKGVKDPYPDDKRFNR